MNKDVGQGWVKDKYELMAQGHFYLKILTAIGIGENINLNVEVARAPWLVYTNESS